jgi:glutaredoxin 3
MSSPREDLAEESSATAFSARVTLISDLSSYGGSNLAENVDAAIAFHDVLVISKTHCPFCLDVKSLFSSILLVPIHVVEVNLITQGSEVHKIVRDKTKQATVPVVFIRGKNYGGCEEIKALHVSGQLEEIVADISERRVITGSGPLETVEARRVHSERGAARNPPFWFPNVVNNYVVRLTGIQVVIICVVAIIYRNDEFAAWLAAYLLLDFFSRMLIGSSLSILGMVATVIVAPIEPQFKPGPPKQFAACCGLIFSLIATCLYFTDNIVAGAVILGLLAGAAGLEGFCDFCLGCIFFSWGIRFKIIPSSVYRIYTSSRHEYVESWRYAHKASGAPPPTNFDTDPCDAAALKYKAAKTDEFTKDDFNLIRNMQIGTVHSCCREGGNKGGAHMTTLLVNYFVIFIKVRIFHRFLTRYFAFFEPS